MSTHWACFDCRKSFAKEGSETLRKCSDCARPMTDMGPYFELPRKAAVKALAGNENAGGQPPAVQFEGCESVC